MTNKSLLGVQSASLLACKINNAALVSTICMPSVNIIQLQLYNMHDYVKHTLNSFEIHLLLHSLVHSIDMTEICITSRSLVYLGIQ